MESEMNVLMKTLADEIIDIIKIIRDSKQRPDESEIYHVLTRKHKNYDISKYDVTNELITLLVTGKIFNKKFNGKNSFYISLPTPTVENEKQADIIDTASLINQSVTPSFQPSNTTDFSYCDSDLINTFAIKTIDNAYRK